MIKDVYIKTHRNPTVIEELATMKGKDSYDILSVTPCNLAGELYYTLVMVLYDNDTNKPTTRSWR